MTNTELLTKLKAEIEKTWLEYECYNEDYDKVAEMRWNEFEKVARHFYELGKQSISSEIQNDLDGGGTKAVRLPDGRYVTEKLARELEDELDKWRHEHFHGKRDDHFSGEYLERTSQLELACHFAQWGAEHAKDESEKLTQEGLEEEIGRIVKCEKEFMNFKFKRQLIGYIARHFAKWGSEHLVSSRKISGSNSEIPNYLNESADYARRLAEELISVIKKYDDYSEEQIEELRTHFMSMFLEGTVWQKEKMMKEAVPFYEILKAVPPGPERENVRIIIVKQD